jgi:hypothetical protein
VGEGRPSPPFFLVRNAAWLRDTTDYEWQVTHIATRERLITQPHPAMECGVVAARRRCQEERDAALRLQHEDGLQQRAVHLKELGT